MHKLKHSFLMTIIFAAFIFTGCGEAPQKEFAEKWSSLTYWKTVSAEDVKAGLKAGMKADFEFDNGHTPLVMAALFNDSPEVIEELIKAGAATGVSKGGQSPLMAAASRNPNPEIIRALLKHKVDVNARGVNGITALLLAADSGASLEVFKLLVENGADIDAKLVGGEGVEQLARRNIKCGPKIMEYLNDRGVVKPFVALEAAEDLALFCERNNVDRVRALLESGVSPNTAGKMRGLPLISALTASTIPLEIVKMLLDKGADPNLSDKSGLNALISFFYNVFSYPIDDFNEKFMGYRNLLEEAGIDAKPDYVGRKKQFVKKSDETELNEEFFEIIGLLKKAGADFSSHDRLGNNILHLAAMGGAGIKAIRILNESGADLNAKNKLGYKPLDYYLIGSPSLEELNNNLKELAIDLSDNKAENIDISFKLIRHGRFPVEVFDMTGSAAAGLVNQDGKNFFHAAVANPFIDNAALENIFSRGYQINTQDTYGQTPFMTAILADNGKNGRIKWMLEREPDLKATDIESRNILHYFAMNDRAEFPENFEIIDQLINARNSDGETPLITAAKNGQSGAVYRLVRAGADIMIEDHQKKTALDHDSDGSIFKCCLNDYRYAVSSGKEGVKDLTAFQYFRLRCIPEAEAVGSGDSTGVMEFSRRISSYIERHKLQNYVAESFPEKPLQDKK